MAAPRPSRTRSALCDTLFTVSILPAAALAQAPQFTLPAGTALPLSTPAHLPMRAGAPIRAELLYPVYADNQLVLPAKTILSGTIVSLQPDHSRRVAGRLRADFTPFHIPIVHFDYILPPDGAPVPISTGNVTDGAPVYRIVPKPAPKGGIIGQYVDFAIQDVRSTIRTFIGPDKGDRFLQFLYNQLPYHPERISRDTSWTVETLAPVTLAAVEPRPVAPPPPPPHGRIARFLAPDPPPPAVAPSRDPWLLEAFLDQDMSSETSHVGDAIHATVARPVLNEDGSVAVPQGSILTGTVSQAKPSRKFARAGILRFNFSEIKLPGQDTQNVRTSLAAADSSSEQQLAMDSEGQVKPKAQDKILVPALLFFLASQPLNDEHDGGARGGVGRNAVASGGLGLLSVIVGTAARQPNVAAGIGYYTAALSIYPRYIARGSKVAFRKDTRIVLQTTPTRSTAIKPTPQ